MSSIDFEAGPPSNRDNKRSVRRHHVERLKVSRRFLGGRDLASDAKALHSAVDTPTPCSCYMCGNPRRYFNEASMQERSSLGLFNCLGLTE